MGLTPTSDALLVRRVRAGDTQAFSELVERYADPLAGLAFAMLRDAEDARDVVQQAFFVAFRDLSSLRDPGAFAPWVRGIVANQCRHLLTRRSRAERFLERLPATAVPDPDPAQEALRRGRAGEVLDALGALDETRRQVVILHYLQGLAVAEVAHLVGRPTGTVKRLLSEARSVLRQELIEMAREEFDEYRLTPEHRERLAKIPRFPPVEPKIATTPLAEEPRPVRALSPHGNFPALEPGAEACYADYDHPAAKLYMVSHAVVEGPFDVGGEPALRQDGLSFSDEGKAAWYWRPYYRPRGDTVLFCAKEYGPADKPTHLITPDLPDWRDAQPREESLRVVPGSRLEPEGDLNGSQVDAHLWEVRIGRRRFRCLRRAGGGGREPVDWSDDPVTGTATEEFFLDDGRLLLWRRYNGLRYSARDPRRKEDARGTYERLAEAGVPRLDVFGEVYYLWYDQIPDYALHGP